MKMKTLNYFSIAFAGLAMFCACNMAELENNAPVAEGDKVELVAGEGQIVCTTPPMTKTAVGAKGEDGSFPVVWVDKDQVKVYGESAAEGAVYTASVDQEAASAVFSADQVAVNDDLRYAVYPAALAGAMTAEGITVDLTSLRNQEYHSNIPNFGQMDKYQLPEDVKDMTQKEYYESATIFPHLPLWAKAENGSSEFKFNNLMGVVKLALNDYQGAGLVIKTVKLTAKTPVSGTMTVDAEGKVSMSGDEDAKSITIFSQPGVKLAAPDGANLKSAGTPFYFFVPAGTYEGFDFEFITTDGRIFRKSTNTTVAVAGGAVKKFPVLNFTLFYGKANCYLAPAGSTIDVDITPRYSFDMTFNGAPVEYVEGAEPKFKAKVEWDIQRGGNSLNGGVITNDASDISVSGNALTVKTNYQGSALVSIRKDVEDEVNPILWSYHIWTVTADSGAADDHYVTDVTYKVGADEFQMMSHNLGATYGMVSNAANAYMTYGMYYQWGRKDPLPAYGTYTYADGVLALFNSAVNQNNTIVEAMNNPLTMFINYDEKNGKRDMATTFPQTVANNVLWGATDALTGTLGADVLKKDGFVKTVYDPCPEGYMVPQLYHFNGMSVAATARTGYGALLYYDDAKEANQYFPLPGVFLAANDVVSGTTKSTGTGGSIRCHVSNAYGSTGWASSYFRAQYASSKVSIDRNYGGAANASSVRCLKIQ